MKGSRCLRSPFQITHKKSIILLLGMWLVSGRYNCNWYICSMQLIGHWRSLWSSSSMFDYLGKEAGAGGGGVKTYPNDKNKNRDITLNLDHALLLYFIISLSLFTSSRKGAPCSPNPWCNAPAANIGTKTVCYHQPGN